MSFIVPYLIFVSMSKENPRDRNRREPTDDGVEERGGVREGLVAVISTQDMPDNPNLPLLNFAKKIRTRCPICSDASNSEIRNCNTPELSGLV
jgi:hypothetical protein